MKSMNIIKRVLFALFTLNLTLFVLSGCGYKPSAYYAKKELSGKIFVKLFIDLQDPKNAVLIKDSMNKLIIQKLAGKLVNKESLADTVMNVKINSVTMSTLQYDELGYNKVYRASVKILVSYTKKDTKVTRSFTVEGENDFSIDDDVITDTKRYDAISSASDDALDEILSKIAILSLKK